MPLSNVPTQVPLRHRGKGAACRSALVRLLPGVTLVVGAQGLLPRRSVRAARPRARVRLLPRVIAVVGVQEGLIGRMDRGRQLAARFGRGWSRRWPTSPSMPACSFPARTCTPFSSWWRFEAPSSRNSVRSRHQIYRSTLWRGCTLQLPAEDAPTQDVRDNRGMPTLKSCLLYTSPSPRDRG